ASHRADAMPQELINDRTADPAARTADDPPPCPPAPTRSREATGQSRRRPDEGPRGTTPGLRRQEGERRQAAGYVRPRRPWLPREPVPPPSTSSSGARR